MPPRASDGRVVVIVSTYNERENISQLLTELLVTSPPVTVIVVDDNSPDGTAELAGRFAEEFPERVHVISQAARLGYASACGQGFQKALELRPEVVVTMDADLSYNPEDIGRLVKAIRTCDLVIGSRYVESSRIERFGPWRRLLSWTANVYVRWVLGLRSRDCTGGFRAYRPRVLKEVCASPLRSRGFSVLVELLERASSSNFRVAEIPIVYRGRTAGKSKMNPAIVLEAMRVPWQLRFLR
jgi:dolichol-phosphate mannosyltransferase